MKAKNSKARRNSFLKFLLLFIITTGLIVGALYFDFNVLPNRENAVLRKQASDIEKENGFQKEFSRELFQLRGMIDSLDMSQDESNRLFLNNVLSNQTVKLKTSIPRRDSTYRYDMYSNIIWSYAEIQKLKNELHSYADIKEDLEKYKEANRDCEEELKEAQRNLDIYRNSSN